MVACAGTALTVEALTAEGDYLGGCILPGYRLMLASWRAVRRIWTGWLSEVAAFPQGTADALATGVVDAMVGAIERMCLRLAEKTGRGRPQLLLTGGDAAQLAPWLAEPVRIVDNLVLMGLLRVAGEQ
ncbi:type III pantothenate kinase [Paludibacterium denitrificans]|uniref:type III pantothenate kinase n=1 Tax=Paludibacterium denitrificans TaxID=2675226 RepID=UPI0028ADEC74|nr:type III pantothenate kinase [Paludibacterium denitrificans]